MGSTSGKYNMTDENSARNRRTTVPSISLKITKSKNEKKSLPKCIHQDILMDSLSSNKDNFTIVWIDTEMHHQSSNIDMQIKLKNLIHYLRIFEELTAFEHYIKKINQINQEKLFVIISTPLALSMIPHLHHLSSIKYIYIYGKAEIDGKIKEKLLKTYPKVKGIFSKCQCLIAQIIVDKTLE